MKKDKSVIPEGLYCYTLQDDKEILCPYWGLDTKHLDYAQENGYCKYLEKGDWDLNEEKRTIEESVRHPDGSYKTTIKKNTSWHKIGTLGGLLWDQCKECGIKYDTMYFCTKCNRKHSMYSRIGMEHERKYHANG
jgi:hypothetical protein